MVVDKAKTIHSSQQCTLSSMENWPLRLTFDFAALFPAQPFDQEHGGVAPSCFRIVKIGIG